MIFPFHGFKIFINKDNYSRYYYNMSKQIRINFYKYYNMLNQTIEVRKTTYIGKKHDFR